MRIKTSVRGAKATSAILSRINNRMLSHLQGAVDASALETITTAKKIVPVDTGRLKNSIRVIEKSPLKTSVGTDLDYANYIEFGEPQATGPHGGPQPYMRPAAEINKVKHKKRIRKAVRDGLKTK